MLAREIDGLLAKADLEGFIEIGAPTDEYTSEARQIAEALAAYDTKPTIEDIRACVFLIWQRSFNLSPEDLELRQAALEKIVERIAALH